jgi:hypothetical protein
VENELDSGDQQTSALHKRGADRHMAKIIYAGCEGLVYIFSIVK